jgi:hypothetical protein
MYRNEPPGGIQKNIICKINDQEILSSIVEENGLYSACAAERLSTQDLCKRFANHPDPLVRRIVVEKIDSKEQEIFKGIIETENDPEIRKMAVNRLSRKEQEIFRSIAKSDEGPSIRMAAIEKIDDSEFLKSLLEGNPQGEISKSIKMRINDLKILEIKKISDQEELKRIILNESSNAVKTAALKNIHDPDILLEIITSNKNLAESAAKQIIGEETLLKVAMDKRIDYSVREAAYKRLKTEKSQALIAAKGGTWNFCFEAAKKVSSPKLLIMIFAEADPMIRSEIIPKLPKSMDSELYQQKDSYTRRAVIKRTGDHNILEKAALEDPDADIRQIAALKITGPMIRKKLESNSPDEVVKEIAGLPLKGKCATCGKQIPIAGCKIRSITGDYFTMHFFIVRDVTMTIEAIFTGDVSQIIMAGT